MHSIPKREDMDPSRFTVVEATIDSLCEALDAGIVTSVELVARYLNRIAYYDRSTTSLNSVPVLNPSAFEEARASDVRRARGEVRGALDGIPYTAKDSYRVHGLTVASGSPAFANLVAGDDAFAIRRLRDEGAVFLGRTNMPPMAAGGMQRGVYGRAESPYSADFLTSAFGSGSSNGSGTATAASLAAFGLGEETWSSGRAPASNNALVAYTPSRGVISVRGNWPLVPTMDVVVPHTRSISDMKHVLDAVVADDPETSGDLWRMQPWVPLPLPSQVRPPSFIDLDDLPLAGLRLAAPRIYINGAPESAHPIDTRESVMELWRGMRADLEAAGAEVVETAFPVVENYEKLHPSAQDFVERGYVSKAFLQDEVGDLSVWAFDNFLRENADPFLHRLADVEPSQIVPSPRGALEDRYGAFEFDMAYDISEYVARATQFSPDWTRIGSLEAGMRGLERTRQVDFEEWLAAEKIDAVIFPTAADVGPADADVHCTSAELAWRNGVWVSNGNLVPRHLGIPTVTIPMGVMADTCMPVGLTIAGAAYDDVALIRLASAMESLRPRRLAPPLTPSLRNESLFADPKPAADPPLEVRIKHVSVEPAKGGSIVTFSAVVAGDSQFEHVAYIDGVRVRTVAVDGRVTGERSVVSDAYSHEHSEWRQPYGPLVVLVARTAAGAMAGAVGTTPFSPL